LVFFFASAGLGLGSSHLRLHIAEITGMWHHTWLCLWFFSFFFFPALQLRALHLLGRHSTSWTTLPALFCIGYFWDRVSWTIYQTGFELRSSWLSASWIARIIDVSHRYSALFCFSDGVWLCWPGWSQIPSSRNPPASTFQVAGTPSTRGTGHKFLSQILCVSKYNLLTVKNLVNSDPT
jgi:hypothetical protein